ncbi:unnamed protein product [Blepharisma stoltei]|uniref:Uncharacterized protein n=1 Tax=Blepharisma stoltei TaxID=1481888 RepID=A0AAU9IJ21_9CILI|nr:unnamed protein product [Blepharisma stoltei]
MEANRETVKQTDATAIGTPKISALMQQGFIPLDPNYNWADMCIDESNGAYEKDSDSYENWSSSIVEDLVWEVKRPGRKKEPDSELLSRFKTKKGIPPKKEYLRCKLIRGHKKLNRQIQSGNLSSKHICAFKQESQRGLLIWNRLQQHFFANRNVLEVESQTESGPTTDGKKKRRKIDKATQKSFNAAFIRHYFNHEATKVSFYYYIELIFLDLDPGILCQKFQFQCCQSENHFDACRESWIALKSYLQRTMLTDLGIPPYIPKDEFLLSASAPTYEDENYNGLFSTCAEFQDFELENHSII